MKCCNCGGTMEPEAIHGVTLQVCTNCKGAWLSGGDLQAVLQRGPLSPEELSHLGQADVTQVRQGASSMVCPLHGAPLDTYHYLYNSPLEVHSCPQCGGLFVSAGEIEQMEQWRAIENAPPTPKEAAAEDMAETMAQELAATQRWRNWGTFFGILNRWSPGWSGLL